MSDARTIAADARVMLQRADAAQASTAWSRLLEQEPQCGYCTMGVSCRVCAMGPCRVDPSGGDPQRGVCGADADLIVARNFGRSIAAGAASHSDHARDILEHFEASATAGVFHDLPKLHRLAAELDVPSASRSTSDIAHDVALALYNDFGTRQRELAFVRRAPQKRRAVWERLGITPRGLDREPAEMLHRTHMGVDSDPMSLLLHALRTALSDGWGGSMLASELSDVLLGTPSPARSYANLGTLRAEDVNVALHGHNPLVCDALIQAAADPHLLSLAQREGARGINIVGLCCTGTEILARRGIPSAGNHLMQELAIMTGALEAIVVDYQCVMPSLVDLSRCFHTEIISTSNKGRLPGAVHVPVESPHEADSARRIITRAIARFPLRAADRVQIPGEPVSLVSGFSVESLLGLLGGSVEPLVAALATGQIRGIVAVVGCNNPKVPQDQGHLELTRRLMEQDVLVLSTGCAAIGLAKAGLLTADAARFAGPGLRALCEHLDLPPVLHFGSCVDNARILVLAAALADHLDVDISDLPLAAAAPEWYSEKALAIATYAVASGIFTVLGVEPAIAGSRHVVQVLSQDLATLTGARLEVAPQPDTAAALIRHHLETKRKALGLPHLETPTGSGASSAFRAAGEARAAP